MADAELRHYWWIPIPALVAVGAVWLALVDSDEDDEPPPAPAVLTATPTSSDPAPDESDDEPTHVELELGFMEATFRWARAEIADSRLLLILSSEEIAPCRGDVPDSAKALRIHVPSGPGRSFFGGTAIEIGIEIFAHEWGGHAHYYPPHETTLTLEPFAPREGEKISGTLEFRTPGVSGPELAPATWTAKGHFEAVLCHSAGDEPALPDAPFHEDVSGEIDGKPLRGRSAVAHAVSSAMDGEPIIESIVFFDAADVSCETSRDPTFARKHRAFYVSDFGGAALRRPILDLHQPARAGLWTGEAPKAWDPVPGHGWIVLEHVTGEAPPVVVGRLSVADIADSSGSPAGWFSGHFHAPICPEP